MKIEKVDIDKLNFAKYNPRIDLQPEDEEYQKLKRSIETFGYVEPVVWNERTGNVVGGHQRLKILISQGYKEVDVSCINVSEQEEKALNIALNKIDGRWDYEKLKEVLSELENTDIDETLSGFTDYEIKEILSDEECNIDNFFTDSEEKKKEPKTMICPHCGKAIEL